MLLFKAAKFALHHPLMTHEARRLLHKKYHPKKEATPMRTKVRGHAFRLVGLHPSPRMPAKRRLK